MRRNGDDDEGSRNASVFSFVLFNGESKSASFCCSFVLFLSFFWTSASTYFSSAEHNKDE